MEWTLISHCFLAYMEIDFVTLIGHALTFSLLAVDSVILGHPIKMQDVIFIIMYFLFYTTFNLIYYVAGGLDREQSHKIYIFMDWKQPAQSFIFIIVLIILSAIAHSIFYGIYRLRNCLRHKIWSPKSRNFDVEKNNFKLTSKY